MSWYAVAAIGGSAILGAISSQSAAGTQAAGQIQAAQTQQNMFNTINAQQQPYIQGGYSSLNSLLYGLGESPVSTSAPGASAYGGAQTFPGQTVGGTPAIPAGAGAAPGSPLWVQEAAARAGGAALPGQNAAAPRLTGPQTGAGGSAPAAGVGFGQFTQGFTPQEFLQNLDPGYGFQLAQGQQATRNADTPGVGALSGAALKDLTTFNQNMASMGYQNAYNRWQNTNNTIFGRLSAIAGLGQNAAANVGASGTSLGTGVAQAQAAAAGSQAAGIVGASNAVTSNSVPLAYLLNGQNNGQNNGGASFGPNGNNSGLDNGYPIAGVNVGGD